MLVLGARLAASAGALCITNISMLNGYPRLLIQSDTGITNQIQFTTNLYQPDWTALTNLPVTQSPYAFVDLGGTSRPAGFYRIAAFSGPAGYYVDSVHGNDSFDGLSPEFPFQTLAALSNADSVFHTDIWNFADGSSWRESLTVLSNGMTLQSYGNGPLPLFDASDIVPKTSWTKTSNCTNTYQATVAISNVSGAHQNLNFYENGQTLFRASSLANCDVTPGTYWVTNDNSYPDATATIWLDPAANSNPGTDANLYEFTSRQSGIYSVATNCIYVGLATRRNLIADGSLRVGGNSVVIGCVASDGGKHNVIYGENCAFINCGASNAYDTYNGEGLTLFVCSTPRGTAGYANFTNCWAYIAPYLENYQTAGYYGHSSAPPQIGSFAYVGCSCTGCANSFNGLAASLLISNCVSDGMILVSATNTIIANTIINTTNVNAVLDGVPGATLVLNENNLKTTARNGQAVSITGAFCLMMTNNVVSGTNNAFGIYVPGAAISVFCSLSNSIAATWDWYDVAATPAIFTSDANVFTSPAGTSCQIEIGGTNYSAPYTTYISAFSVDAHSVFP